MNNIDLNDFIEKVKQYQDSPYAVEYLYSKALSRRDVWDNLQKIGEPDTRQVVLSFVNAWKCRLSYDCAHNLTNALRDSSTALSNLRNNRLENLTIGFLIDNLEIPFVFEKISSAKATTRTVGGTATSKILHMINPALFVMYDANIRYGWGCSDNSQGYVNFLWRMKLFSDALLSAYTTSRNVSRDTAFKELASECESSAITLSKLLDEYNWIKYNS